ncbi:hypothetical protein ALT_5860 [Aspergillus lentulus]|uniref:N,O-diacetylmuramidase n=1 Tax=Aspergillus lentulus TaxID=293939 RepID=A0AAN4TBU3_ASPLE|nr:hypothetical protein ALT_5860 [Aspergillus lentulus]
MAPLLTRLQDCGWTSADVPEIKDKKASITLRDSVDLSLSYSPENLCSAFISEYQRSLGLQPGIITLLNASWLVTVRCICPVQDIHLGVHSPGVYFIARLPHRADRQVAIELNCEAPVRNLVRDVSLLQSEATSHMSLGDDVSDEAPEKFPTTTITYAEELSALTGGSSGGNLNKGIRQPINSKLFLRISQANGELHAKLTFSVSDISRDLALTATQNGTEGIDLFEVHLPVDWKGAVANGLKFVFVKATEGINYQNLRFPTQTAGAVAAGIVHGAVHFASAAESSGADQADFFIEHGGNWTADGQTLPGVLEMEGNIAGKLCHGMTPIEITDWMLDFSHRYKVRTGRPPILFLSASWWAKCAGNNATFGEDHALWLANWAEEMGLVDAWTISHLLARGKKPKDVRILDVVSPFMIYQKLLNQGVAWAKANITVELAHHEQHQTQQERGCLWCFRNQAWAIVHEIPNDYPSPTTFDYVTALTNRSLSRDVAQWSSSDKLQVVSGLDLLRGDQASLEDEIKKKSEFSTDVLKRAVTAIENLSPRLEAVVSSTGTKAYGIHLLDNFPWSHNLPLRESLPRIPEPYASQLFYYSQLDLLNQCPKANAGLVAISSPMRCPYRKMHGEGADAVFSGTMKSWVIKSNDSSQDIIARFAIHARLHPEVSGGESFNTADNCLPSS